MSAPSAPQPIGGTSGTPEAAEAGRTPFRAGSVGVSAPVEQKVTGLMAALDQSVREAKASRDRLVAAREAIRTTPVGARVRVMFPGNDWHDAETIDGTVTDRDDDSLEITPDGATIGEDFTLYRSELAAGRATLEVL